MRRNLLAQLTIAILLPYIGGFLIAWLGFYQFEKTMEKVAASYAQNIAYSAAARIESSQWEAFYGGEWRNKKIYKGIIGIDESLLTGINVPGVFAVYDNSGNMLYGQEEAKLLALALEKPPRTGEAQKSSGPDGHIYTVAVYPVLMRNIYVVAAVDWDDLLGQMVPLATFWPFITGLLGLIGIFTVYIMWQKVILPLKDLEQEISTLKWGVDVPLTKAPEAVEELQSLRQAIVSLANSAIEKAKLSRRYVNDLIRVQEEERENISREIHDGALQDITALVQRLRLIADDDNITDEQLRLVQEAGKIAMTGVRDLRSTCNGLTPPWLDLGIAQALTELSERMSEQQKINISLYIDEIERLPEGATLAFYRVSQEAIYNSVQHGKAENVRISLKDEGESVVLQIEDDGQGFEVPDDIAEFRVGGHRGLSNMLERMSLVGGTITITSGAGEGTIIHCVLPHKQGETQGKN